MTNELVNLRTNDSEIKAEFEYEQSRTNVVNQVTAKNRPERLSVGSFHSIAEQAMIGIKDSWKKRKRVLRKRCCKNP